MALLPVALRMKHTYCLYWNIPESSHFVQNETYNSYIPDPPSLVEKGGAGYVRLQ